VKAHLFEAVACDFVLRRSFINNNIAKCRPSIDCWLITYVLVYVRHLVSIFTFIG